MASLAPFRALRVSASAAARVAAVPYDVVTTEEARALAAQEPLSFLHVSRPEVDLPPDTDPHASTVYAAAASRFERLKQEAPFERDETPALYVYRLRMGAHEQSGVTGAYSLDDYEHDVIKKHERTRRDKEDDRTHHMLALGAQTGPVFLTYRASAAIDEVVSRVSARSPLIDFEAIDGVRHTIWRASPDDAGALAAGFNRVPALYIADGHHRAASAARVKQTGRCSRFLGVAFPDNQVRILPYNRTVADLNGLSRETFLDLVGARFDISAGGPSPAVKGEISMYLPGQWSTLRARGGSAAGDAIGGLDVSVLQEQLLDPVLGVHDVRTDPRIEFVGGARGTGALEHAVDTGLAAVAFSLFPVGVSELMAIADAGQVMPPKSTWFEPKLRDGLLIHEL
jgi:uncharacterized protein (DUF1015 family)